MKREIRRIEIEPAENGGHTVTHRFRESPNPGKPNSLAMQYHEPEAHVFGPGDGPAMMQHVAKHLKIGKMDGGE